MKRFHVHVHVGDLAANIRYYSALFGAQPVVTKADYAKWMLDDPRLNFAISTRAHGHGVSHLGLQVDTAQELAEIAIRGAAAELASVGEKGARCCYARSNKHWFTDPQGVSWETFETFGGNGTGGETGSAGSTTRNAACCTP